MKKILSTRYNDTLCTIGLLLLRLVFGGTMLIHGFGKLTSFNTVRTMNQVFGSPTDAVLVVFAEFFCAAFLVLGLFTRLALIPLIICMGVAFFITHNFQLSGTNSGETALLFLTAFICLLCTGPGKVSIDRLISK